MPTRHPHRYLLPLTAFLAILPLLVKGPTCGHDFDFHLLSWLEAATQYAHGGYPHWAYTPAYNAGEPRFLFYPPLSWTLGALLTLVLPIQFVATAFTFLAMLLSGLTAHRLASRYAPPQAALLAATLYQLNPYMLFTAYERSAFAELLAAAWLPLLFQAALPSPCRTWIAAASSWSSWTPSFPRQVLHLALPIALLWLTNAPAAVMGCYTLALLTLLRLLLPINPDTEPFPFQGQIGPSAIPTNPGAPSSRGLIAKGWDIVCGRKRPSSSPGALPVILSTLAGTALGLLLPAFYLLPAAYERRYVQITLATITGMRPQDHFLFHRMPGLTPDDLFHNEVVRTASIISLLLLAAIALAFFSQIKPSSSRTKRLHPLPSSDATEVERPAFPSAAHILLPLALLLAFLLTPPSLVLWTHTPQLAFLQFPWAPERPPGRNPPNRWVPLDHRGFIAVIVGKILPRQPPAPAPRHPALPARLHPLPSILRRHRHPHRPRRPLPLPRRHRTHRRVHPHHCRQRRPPPLASLVLHMS